IGSEAVYAIAIHNNPAADAALESLLSPTGPRRIRDEVAIFLGSERSEHGLAILRKIVKSDSDEKFREDALVGFSQSGTEAGRREAVRWLGQTNDPRSLAFLEEILLGPKK